VKPILTMDIETDPFQFKKRIAPFCIGLYDGKDFASVWSERCVDKMMKHVMKLDPSIIYMHNGGKFDIFMGLIPYLEGDAIIIDGRIVKGMLGRHELRDSYSILPMALKQYKKDDIDITKLNAECRELHRAEILSYLRGDCVYLHELVSAFFDEFGDYLTIGSAAMAQLRKFHPFEKTKRYFDEKFRSQFFFGGRVQCFQSGIIEQDFKIYDVNSMYPFVMQGFQHPTGSTYELDREVTKNSAFIVADGTPNDNGSFPLRTRNGIQFPRSYGTYAFTIHEWEAALETKSFRPHRVLKTYNFKKWICFDEFVSHFFAGKQKAKRDGDKIHEIFYKFVLNSAYGKFAQNPDNFSDFAITHWCSMPAPWIEYKIYNEGEYVISKKTIQRHSYYNVSIGASITGAARSVLMRALSKSEGLVYCDTDSVIARSISDVPFHDSELGAWKLEGQGNRIAMAGKKLYACFDGEKCIKKAHKGSSLTPAEIFRVAQDESIIYRKEAPTFKLDGRVTWIERKIKKTA
jgi:DNA polymerase elongation subunit (family B)